MSEPAGRDARGWRAKFGCLAPSTNTIVQPDYDDLRVPGVTGHYSRILVKNLDVSDNASFRALTDAIRVQYGDRMNDEQMAKVGRSIAGGLDTAERLRRFPLPIAAEPAFVYRVAGGPPR